MPLYIGDYVADTSRLSTEQHGAYLLLLMDYWRNGAPPDDDAVLASIVRLATPAWRKHRTAISAFFVIEDGKWRQKRAEQERSKALVIADKRSVAGKQGAARRWADTDSKTTANALANAIALPTAEASQTHWQNDAPSPSPKEEEKAKNPVTHRGRGVSKSGLPADFGISPAIRTWASENGFTRLDERLTHFTGYAIANGKSYANWDAAFRNAIRDDWARLNGGLGSKPAVRHPDPVPKTLEELGL